MIKKPSIGAVLALAVGFGAAAPSTYAGTAAPAKEEVVIVEEEKPAFSGWLSFDLNSHFISYGADVWASGTSWGRGVFNPSAELAWATPIPGLTGLVGTWWDVNNNTKSAIGGYLQEVDIWAGLSYAYEDLSVTVLYQAWMYGGQTEQILDVILKYANNTFLNPAITFHNRLDPGAAEGGGGKNGTFFVPNISYNLKLWKFTITPSAAIGFATDDFHGGGGGYGYTALGLNASVPIPYLPGSWELHGGVTYYNTNDYVIPNNVADNFVTGNIGVKLSF
ncbi:MAG TPA: hypothetical protein VIS74_07975 [Chthoniobacterales bacterium]